MVTGPAEVFFSLAVGPGGRVHPSREAGFGFPLAPRTAERIEAAFARGPGHGLLHLGAEETSGELGPTAGAWRGLARLFLTRLCTSLDLEEAVAAGLDLPLADDEVRRFLDGAPPMLGIEYLSAEAVRRAWSEIGAAFLEELRGSGRPAAEYLAARSPLWSTVGRVFFHLAENRSRPEVPFAFLATYTSRISAQGKVQHVPLARAVKDRADAASREGLLALLVPVRRAAEESAFLRELVDSGRIFQTLAWSSSEAHRFLRDVPLFEEKGISVRVPDWWNRRAPARVRVGVTVGRAAAAGLGADALLDFSVDLSLDGEPLTEEERRRILEGAGDLALVKGRWVEVDRERLKEVLRRWKSVERNASRSGISFTEAMRLLARVPAAGPAEEAGGGPAAGEDRGDGWLAVEPGPWLKELLDDLRSPSPEALALPSEALRADLRPYQVEGVKWLLLLRKLRLGGCLADDMGLGKTIQVIALLLLVQREAAGRGNAGSGGRRSSSSPLPSSGTGSRSARGSRPGSSSWWPIPRRAIVPPPALLRGSTEFDLVVTTYGMVSRLGWLAEVEWGLAVLDEAQAIKNPATRQARAVKTLRALHRLALTGTPIENRLSDLWSLFDFLSPGLLGSAGEFSRLAGRRRRPGGPRSTAASARWCGPTSCAA